MRRGSWLRLLGAGLSLAGLAWVVWPLVRHGRKLAAGIAGRELVAGVVGGALVYALASALLALAWWRLTALYGERIPWATAYAIYARSQLAKYLPTNTLHYVGRHALGRAAGLSHAALAAASLLEMGSLLLAAVLLGGGLAAGRLGAAPAASALPWAALLGLACLAAWPLADRLLRRLPHTARWMEGLPRLGPGRSLRLLGPALLCHLAFFAVTGLLLVVLAHAAAPEGSGGGELGTLALGAYPLAWMAGTVAVGAPAGVGVREAVLALQLEPSMGAAAAAAAALALRLVTLAGDLLTAAAGAAVARAGRSGGAGD